MKIGRTALTVLVAGCALSASAMAQPVAQEARVSKAGQYVAPGSIPAAHVRPTHRLVNGQWVALTQNPGGPRPRGGVVGFNNQDCTPCTGGLNVGFVQPGSYDGSNSSTQASIFGLGDGPAGSSLRAATNANFPLPTDIVWNEYQGDETVWPGGPDAEAAVVEYSFVTARQNTGAAERTDTYRILFFTADGLEARDGFQFGVPTAAGAFFYQQVIIPLDDFDPPLFIPRTGLMMVDCPAPAEGQPAVGVGLAFAGGDLVNPNFPLPETLVAVGATDAAFWVFADGETGIGGAPNVVDPMFDMMDGVSYLDVLNTGALVNWGFTSTAPGGAIGTRTLAHDFPARMTMTDGTLQLGACVQLAGQNCFVTTEADCALQEGVYVGDGTVCGDFFGACCVEGVCSETLPAVCTVLEGEYNGDFTACSSTKCTVPETCPCDFDNGGSVNSQDFFNFLTAFFNGDASADFNEDLQINSQDFFDFLGCFFAPPKGCN